ncbi:MAG: carbohydrate ABC transporter permease [Clostridiales bacterium]|nr:carbohydrate ABC transporter permease [Clostridiales bacterium]
MTSLQVGKKSGNSRKIGLILLEILAVVLFLLFMVPFFIVLINSAKTDKEIINNVIALPSDWTQLGRNISAIFNESSVRYVKAFVDSTVVTFGSLAVILFFSSMCAWVLVRNKKKWSTALFMVFVSAMVIPFQVVMFPLVQWFKILGNAIRIPLLGTYQGIFLAYLGFGCSMSIFILHGFIKNVPLELEEAATIDGCSQGMLFFRIVLPLLQPVCITVLILNGIWIWNDYLLPLLLLGTNGNVRTLPLAVTAFAGAYVKQWHLILTSTLLAMLPVIVFFLFGQKYIIQGMVDGAIK